MSEIQFPVAKKKRAADSAPVWTVTPTQIAAWQRDFMHLDIEREVRKAHAWIVANVAKRKTASGMPKFLVAWFMRAEGAGTMERRTRADRRQGIKGATCSHEPRCQRTSDCIMRCITEARDARG